MSRINTNVPSLVAARILTNNNNTLSTALERLSTGMRVNRGKDDPAGLIASERLRAEMTAITAAVDNAERADNMISVAEGGLQEISALLIELEGLIDRSSSEAGLSAEEVAANQLEVDTILETINRIATSTEFSGKKLLNGSLDYTTASMPASGISDLKINNARVSEGSSKNVVIAVTASAELAKLSFNGTTTPNTTTTIQVSGKYGTEQFTFASSTAAATAVEAIKGAKALTGVSAKVSGGRIVFTSTEYGSDAFVSVEALQGTFAVTGGSSATKDYGKDVGATVNGVKAVTNGLSISVRSTGLNMDAVLSEWVAVRPNQTRSFNITGGGANFSIAPTLGVNAMASIGIQSVTTGNLGSSSQGFLSSLGTGQANQLTEKKFETAQRIIRQAASQVANLRGQLGAFQKNTLTSTMNSLQVTLENVTAAESAIRDTDFALETSRLTRAQILVNASTSTLQQANAAPQNILALLR